MAKFLELRTMVMSRHESYKSVFSSVTEAEWTLNDRMEGGPKGSGKQTGGTFYFFFFSFSCKRTGISLEETTTQLSLWHYLDAFEDKDTLGNWEIRLRVCTGAFTCICALWYVCVPIEYVYYMCLFVFVCTVCVCLCVYNVSCVCVRVGSSARPCVTFCLSTCLTLWARC
jgi:hypothetical protein